MARHNKGKWILFVILLAAGSVFAAENELQIQEHFPPPVEILERANEINLSEKQRQDILRIANRAQVEVRALKVERDRELNHLDSVLGANDTTKSVTKSVAQRVFELENQIKLLHLEMLIDIQDTLTQSQLEQFRSGQPGRIAEYQETIALEPFVVTTERKRELALRLIDIGLHRARSGRIADIDKVVCQWRIPTGSHINRLVCATNLTWEFWRTEFTKRVYTVQYDNLTPYFVQPGRIVEVMGIARAEFNLEMRKVRQSESGKVSNENALREFLIKDAIGFQRSAQGHDLDTLVKFVNAYRKVKSITQQYEQEILLAGSPSDQRKLQQKIDLDLERAIVDAGLDIDSYNRLATDVEKDRTLHDAIARALLAKQF